MNGPRPRPLRRRCHPREQVPPPAEAVDDPVEVALALPVAFVVGQARVATVLVPDGGQPIETDRAARRRLFAFVAQDEAPPDVEVPIEAEPLVERPTLRGSPRDETRSGSPRWRRHRRPVRPRTCAGLRDDPPATGHRHGLVVEGADQGRHDVAGRFDARVEQDDDRGAGTPDTDVGRGGVAQALARPDDLDRELRVARSARSAPAPRPARRTARRRRPRPTFPRAMLRGVPPTPVPDRPASPWRSTRPWPDPSSVRTARDARAGPVADPLAFGQSGGAVGRQCEIGAAVGDLPAGRLDLRAEPVGLVPLPRRPSRRAGMGGRQDVVRDPPTGHARPAWTTSPSFAAAAAMTSSMTSRSRSAVCLNRIQPRPRFAFGSRSVHGSTPMGEA